MLTKSYLKDLLERIVTTFILTYCGLVLAASDLSLDKQQVALVAAVAAGLALVKNFVTQLAGAQNGLVWWQDMLLRCMATYVQVVLALVIVGDSIDLTQLKPALLAGIPAVLGVIKGYVASKFGDPRTAGFYALAA